MNKYAAILIAGVILLLLGGFIGWRWKECPPPPPPVVIQMQGNERAVDSLKALLIEQRLVIDTLVIELSEKDGRPYLHGTWRDSSRTAKLDRIIGRR